MDHNLTVLFTFGAVQRTSFRLKVWADVTSEQCYVPDSASEWSKILGNFFKCGLTSSTVLCA